MNEIVLPAAQFTPTTWMPTNDLSYDEWKEVGRGLSRVDAAVNWWIGDWINYGEKEWGEKYIEGLEIFGDTHDYSNLRDISYVCRNVSLSFRNDKLTFTHHRQVAKIDDEGKSMLLTLAEQDNLSVRELRTAVSEYQRNQKALPSPELTDSQLFEELGIKVQPYDVWQFQKCHDQMGSDHPGRIPGQLIAHVLYFFTKQGDLVIDPMVGSGTTLDACRLLNRRCFGYDIDDRHDRPDILKHDIARDGWPNATANADLIFWDPPYFEKMDSSTIGSNGYGHSSISKLSRQKYLDFFAVRLAQAHGMVKPGTRLAFLMSDWDDNTGEREGIFVWHYADLLRQAGWKLIRHIQAPLSTQQVHPDIVLRFRESRRLARLERYLLMAVA